jgi:hypothetical protein
MKISLKQQGFLENISKKKVVNESVEKGTTRLLEERI